MKKALLLVLLLCVTQNAWSEEIQQWQAQQMANPSSKETKIYSSSGSLESYVKPQDNGTVKIYNKYHQYNGYYKQDGSKLKYFPKR